MKFYEDECDDSENEQTDVSVKAQDALNGDDITKLEKQLDRINMYIKSLWINVIKDYINDDNSCFILDTNDYCMYDKFATFVHKQNPIIDKIKQRIELING